MCIKKPVAANNIRVIHERTKPTSVRKKAPVKGKVGTGIKKGEKKGAKAVKSKVVTGPAKPAKGKATKNKPAKEKSGTSAVEETPVKAPEAEKAPEPEKAPMAAEPEPAAPPEPDTRNGQTTIRYNHYDKKFETKDGKLTAAAIDEEYALSFVFEGAKMHLSLNDPKLGYGFEKGDEKPELVPEKDGTFSELDVTKEYFIIMEETSEAMAENEKKQKEYAERAREEQKQREENPDLDVSSFGGEDSASCSCIEGNPCMSKYNCKDWNNR